MKRFVIWAATICAACLPAYSQLLLNAGDVWTYEFTSLPQLITGSGSASLLGGYSFSLSGYTVGSDLLQIEMFENSVDAPANRIQILNTDPPPDGDAEVGAWADSQGVVRFSMLSGSAILEDVTFFYQTPTGPDSWRRNELTVVPVPEPATWTLLALGALFVVPRFAFHTWARRSFPAQAAPR